VSVMDVSVMVATPATVIDLINCRRDFIISPVDRRKIVHGSSGWWRISL